MERCCSHCQKLLSTNQPHQYLSLVSAVTDSELFKCNQCDTYIHHALGQWDIFMIGTALKHQTPHSTEEKKGIPPFI